MKTLDFHITNCTILDILGCSIAKCADNPEL